MSGNSGIDYGALLKTSEQWADKQYPKPKYEPLHIAFVSMIVASLAIYAFIIVARLPFQRFELEAFWASAICGAIPGAVNWYRLRRNNRFATQTYLKLLAEERRKLSAQG